MSQPRIIFQDWIVQLGYDPGHPRADAQSAESGEFKTSSQLAEEIGREVKKAMTRLAENEREFIRQYYYMGRTYQQIADATGRKLYRLEALHNRAVRKLKKQLTPFVKKRFGPLDQFEQKQKTERESENNCPICKSGQRIKVDRIIAGRDKSETWRPVIQKLKAEFNICVSSPQQLIGHEKYH
ncbi:MAG: sigma-70 family RNA polymerase sigma factor [bacterium]|nr:sigma-70 family RNA polymerase sigma factor [bacterium]